MNKHSRLTKAQRQTLFCSMTQNLIALGLPPDTARAALAAGRPSFADQLGRRVARFPEYAETGELTLDLLKRALADWIAYKAGFRYIGTDLASEPSVAVEITSGIFVDPDEAKTERLAAVGE